MHSDSENFAEQQTSTNELEVLRAAIAEGEDICAEFAIEIQREAHAIRRKPELISKEVGE